MSVKNFIQLYDTSYVLADGENLAGSAETGNTATLAHTEGSYFLWRGEVYRALTAIAIGDSFATGTNCVKVLITDKLVDIDNTLAVAGKAADAKATGDAIKSSTDALASEFSTATVYVAGDIVWYDGKLYRFITNHTAGSWNSAHVAEEIVGDDIDLIYDADEARFDIENQFKNKTINLLDSTTLTTGYILVNNVPTTQTNYFYSDYIKIGRTFFCYRDQGASIGYLISCYDADKNYIGAVDYGAQKDGSYYERVTGTSPTSYYKIMPRRGTVYIRVNGRYTSNLMLCPYFYPEKAIGYGEIYERNALKVAMFGDSITYGTDGNTSERTDLNLVYWLSKLTPYMIDNYGEGSMGWVSTEYNNRIAYDKISEVDLTKYDVITLCFGVNDSAATMGSYDSTDETTIMGQVNKCIKYIGAQNPSAKIIIIAPWNGRKYGTFPDWRYASRTSGGFTRFELSDELQRAAAYYHCGFISQDDSPLFAFGLGTVNNDKTGPYLGSDNVHPSEAGYKAIGYWLSEKLKDTLSNAYGIRQIDTTLAVSGKAADSKATGDAIAAAEATNMAAIAPEFSAETIYAAGQFVWYNGGLYQFITDHAVGSWNGAEVKEGIIGTDTYVAKQFVDIMNGNRTPLTDFGETSLTDSGITVDDENGKLKLYGTASAARNLLCLNGQKVFAWSSMTFSQTLPAGTYYIKLTVSGNAPANYRPILSYTYTTFANALYTASERIITVSAPIMLGLLISKNTNYGTSENPTYIDIKVVAIKEKANAEDTCYLVSTGDTTDRTADILAKLNKYGVCELGKGDFYTTGIAMPASTTLRGAGDATKLILAATSTGNTITMGTECTVKDISVLGGVEDITIGGNFVGNPVEDTTATNLYANGDVEIGSDGFVHLVLTNPLPAGTYQISALVTKDSSDTTDCYFGFSTSQTTTITTGTIITTGLLKGNVRNSQFFTLSTTAYSVRLCTKNSASASSGAMSEWSDINITEAATRCGIAWGGSTVQHGSIMNCRISRFECAGIIAYDTSTPTDHNLSISDCMVENCNVGIFLRRNTEFHKIVNCTLVDNQYGYINRGGNNDLANSGIDSNVCNAYIDAGEGTNNGHGTITGCSFNHANSNTGYGLIIKDTGRMLVSNCNFYYAKIKLQNTNGNVINGCGFGQSTGIEITGGYCNIIANCMMRNATDTPITITGNETIKIVNCWTRGGDAITAS